MSKVLIAWELGGNYGHVAKLVPLTRALNANGHQVALAVKDVAALKTFLGRDEAIFLQAPVEPLKNYRLKPVSFADIIEDHGFGNADRLEGLVRGWNGIFNLFRPDVIVGEYALSAVFAAKLAAIPCLRVDTGFAIPPETSPYPCFRPWLKLQRRQLLEKENKILDVINRTLASYGQTQIDHLFQAVRADLSLLTCFPELDHYPVRQGGRYIGLISNLGMGKNLQWPEGSGPRVFAYLRPIPNLGKILAALESFEGQAIAVIPGISVEMRMRFAGKGLTISDTPALLSQILPESDLVVSHATPGLTTTALLQGVPSLGIPTQIEQMMFSGTLERHNIGTSYNFNTSQDHFQDVFLKSLYNKELHRGAREFADKYAGYDERRTLSRLVRTIERLPEIVNCKMQCRQEQLTL